MSFTFRPAIREQVPLPQLGTGKNGRLRTHECIERKCYACKRSFIPMRKAKGWFCSNACANAWIARTTAKTRGDKQRGQGNGLAYRKLYGRHEHRVIAEKKIGRPLRKGEIVHHVDGNKLNNDPNNLEVFSSQAEHMRKHGLGIPGMTLPWKPWEYRGAKSI